MELAIVANLVAYSIVVSQPLAYVVFLTKAQRALSAPAYIELRQCIDPVMAKRLPLIYLAALMTGVLLLVLSVRDGNREVLITVSIALLCLVTDVVLAVRKNVPINTAIDRWSTTDYPADWETYRSRWFAVFGYRQAVLLAGFFSLLVGALGR